MTFYHDEHGPNYLALEAEEITKLAYIAHWLHTRRPTAEQLLEIDPTLSEEEQEHARTYGFSLLAVVAATALEYGPEDEDADAFVERLHAQIIPTRSEDDIEKADRILQRLADQEIDQLIDQRDQAIAMRAALLIAPSIIYAAAQVMAQAPPLTGEGMSLN